jgi:hypothetical protein
MGTGSVPWVKWPGRGVDHPPPSSAEVKERVELYLPLWAFMACCRENFTFIIIVIIIISSSSSACYFIFVNSLMPWCIFFVRQICGI